MLRDAYRSLEKQLKLRENFRNRSRQFFSWMALRGLVESINKRFDSINRPLVQKKCSLAEQVEKHVNFYLKRVRKWASKTGCTMSWEAVWRGHFVRGAIQKVSPSSLPRNANIFFFNPASEIGIPGGRLAFPPLEQIYSLCGGGRTGSQNCILVGGRPRSAPGDFVIATTHFHPLPKIAFWS